MKTPVKILIGVFLCMAFMFAIRSYRNHQTSPLIPNLPIVVEPTDVEPHYPTVSFDGFSYSYIWFKVENNSKLALIPNFDKRMAMSELVKQNGCSYAINAGFYDTNYKPLGLWINNEGLKGNVSSSTLINGFLSISNKATISVNKPSESRLAIQTGPLLATDKQNRRLSITNDERARRSVALVLTNGTLIFITIYNGESVYDGPKLTELPSILSLIANQEKWNIQDAINLDGGSASAIVTPTRSLQEFQPVGSIFCY